MKDYAVGMVLTPEDVAYVTRAANVFDELLAVAKAVGSANENPAWIFDMSDALAALDAAHPGWREWR